MAKKHDVYMPLIIGDWLKGTRGMKAEIRGVYLSLLIHQWDNGFIPSDLEELSLIEPEISKAWEKIKHKFLEVSDGKLQNDKMEEVRAYWSKQSQNGKKGGRPVKPKDNPNSNPKDNPKDNPNNILHNDSDFDSDTNSKKGDIGGVAYRGSQPPSIAMVQELFRGCGLTDDDGETFWRQVNGRFGWNSINNWLDYSAAAAKRKLEEKKKTGMDAKVVSIAPRNLKHG